MRQSFRSSRLAGAVVVVGVLAAACDGTTGPRHHLDLEVEGWLERGAEVRLTVLQDGDPLPPGSATWTAEPEHAVDWLPDDRARFTVTGPVTLTARVADGSARRTVSIEPPPTIVFDLVRDGQRDIYSVQLDGGELRRLTDHPRPDAEPTVAGDLIIFTTFRNGRWDLYSVPLGGGTATALVATAAAERHPALAPDGSRLLFTREYATIPKLVHLDLGSGAETRPTNGIGFHGAIEVSPTWAPDNRIAAFVSTTGGPAALFLLSPPAGAPEPVATDAGGGADFDPAWSRNGTRLAFASNRSGETDLYILELETGQTTRLTDRPGSDGQAAWLPDGRLVYASWENGTPGLRWIDPDRPETSHAIPTGAGAARNPAATGR
jgi:TolB protein